MRASYVFVLLCVLFATCCDGLQSEKNAFQENDKFDNNIVGHEDNRHLRSTDNEALDHGNAALKKFVTEQRELTDTSERADEERSISDKLIKVLSKSSTLSTKNGAAESVVAAAKKNTLFGKMNGFVGKKVSGFTKKDVEVLKKSPSYKNLGKVIGKDPMMATSTDLKRAEAFVAKNKGKRGVPGIVKVLGIILGIAVLGGGGYGIMKAFDSGYK